MDLLLHVNGFHQRLQDVKDLQFVEDLQFVVVDHLSVDDHHHQDEILVDVVHVPLFVVQDHLFVAVQDLLLVVVLHQNDSVVHHHLAAAPQDVHHLNVNLLQDVELEAI